jgi:hypothetical protein
LNLKIKKGVSTEVDKSKITKSAGIKTWSSIKRRMHKNYNLKFYYCIVSVQIAYTS